VFAVAVGAFGVMSACPSVALAATKTATTARVTFGVEPASAKGPDALPHFAIGATPGASQQDHVAVLNYSAQPLSLQLYATDAINTSNGGFGLLPATTKPTGVGSWVHLPRHSATVVVPKETAKKPGQVIVPFTLRVPTTATPGDHVGGIVASLRTLGKNASGQNVILEQRVGTRVFVRVAGALAPGLSLADLHATYHGVRNPFGRGYTTVSYEVRNTGNVELALNQGVTVSGLFGAKQGVTVRGVPLLLPGDAVQETARVSGVLPQFIDHASVTAQSVAPNGDVDPRLPPAHASARLWAVPWTLIALIVLVLVALRLGFVIRKRRASATEPRRQVAQQVNA
jgi:hypothetical protein